jgi:hypoxanthine phosphoribosyltransferase
MLSKVISKPKRLPMTKIKCLNQQIITMNQNRKIDVLYDKNKIRHKVIELGQQITADYKGEPIHVVGVLKGSFIFYADLVRSIDLPMICDFIQLSSYGNDTKSSGNIIMKHDVQHDIEGKHVLLVEDIIDSGLTMKYLLENMSQKSPASVTVCTLLHKPGSMKVDIPIKYVGFNVPDEFVIGYGLDFAEMYRNLPYIGILDKNFL